MFPVPTPPASVAPAHVKLARVVASEIRFPSDPLLVAVTVTTPAAELAVTPRFEVLFRMMALARFVAWVVVVPPTRKFNPVFDEALEVRTKVVAGLEIVTVWPPGSNPVKVPVRLAAVVGDTPARLVLNAT